MDEFREHRKAAFEALSDLSARYEPIAGDGQRLAARATVTGCTAASSLVSPRPEEAELAGGAPVRGPRRAHRRALDGRHAAVGLPADDRPGRAGRRATAGGPVRPVPRYTAAEQQAPLDAYMAMVAGHDASVAQKLYTDDYLQHGPFGPNLTREEFEAGNRDVVWKAMPDISIQLEPFLADGELVAYRGFGQGNHTGAELFGMPSVGTSPSPKPTSCGCAQTRCASTGFKSTCSACSAS